MGKMQFSKHSRILPSVLCKEQTFTARQKFQRMSALLPRTVFLGKKSRFDLREHLAVLYYNSSKVDLPKVTAVWQKTNVGLLFLSTSGESNAQA